MGRQTSLQLTEATERQVEALKLQGFGTLTDVVRIAVDRMYQKECNMSGYNVVGISAEFSNGSFEEWANHHEEQDAADIERWSEAYYNQVRDELSEMFPYAKDIDVYEGHNQLMDTQWTFKLTPGNEYKYDELRTLELAKRDAEEAAIRVSNYGLFWEG